MRERLKQLAAVSALVLVAGASLVACSDKNGSADGEGTSAGADLTQSTFFDKVIEAQAKAGSSHMAMNMDVGGQTIKADGDIEVGETARRHRDGHDHGDRPGRHGRARDASR